MWFGLTIARSSPASTQWCRKTELSTARAGGETPNETLETPSEVLTPGHLGLDPADALDRLDRRRLPLVVAGRERERERVEDQQLGIEPVLVAGELAGSACAISTLRSAVFAIPTSSIVSAISAAPCALRQRHDRSSLSRPASRLIELTIARPGIRSSAASITSGSVESTWIGAGWVSETRFTTSPICTSSSWRSVERDADVEHVGAALDLVLGDLDEAVVVVGEQQLLRLP